MWGGAAAFGMSVIALIVIGVLVGLTNGSALALIAGPCALVGAVGYAASKSRQSTGTYGFVAGYFLTMGIVLLVAGGGCFLIIAGSRF
jgi:hypothetical protein